MEAEERNVAEEFRQAPGAKLERPSAPRHPAWKKSLYRAVPLLVLLGVGELLARLHAGAVVSPQNYRSLRLEQDRGNYPVAKDSRLGYVPRPSATQIDKRWGKPVTIDGEGFRTNGPGAPPPGTTVLAVGDSFTFGVRVGDAETWPARLQAQIRRPVKNGGVFGYSLTQTVLRAEETLERMAADWLVVSFIPDDLARSELSKRYAWMPWFDLVDGKLVLRNSPVVEQPPTERELASRRLKDALGHSALIDFLLTGTVHRWWFMNEKEVRVHPPGTGTELGVKLVDRTIDLCAQRGCRLMWVLQGHARHAGATIVLEHAQSRGVPVLDLVERLLEQERQEPGLGERLFDGHMTAEGNAWVAAQIAPYLEQLEREGR